MLTKERIIVEANELGVEAAALKAVDTVESGGKGFLDNGDPVILFEPHVFWKELKVVGIDPQQVLKDHSDCNDILYPIWGSKPYGKSTQQHSRLQRAVVIHKEAALKSASWGRYQIMGFNYSSCGCSTIQEFINKVYKSEDDHLDLFSAYLKTTGLNRKLRLLSWALFAEGYNGKGYKKNRYDEKLAAAYKKAKLEGW